MRDSTKRDKIKKKNAIRRKYVINIAKYEMKKKQITEKYRIEGIHTVQFNKNRHQHVVNLKTYHKKLV